MSFQPARLLPSCISNFGIKEEQVQASVRQVQASVRQVQASVRQVQASVRQVQASVRQVQASVRQVQASVRQLDMQHAIPPPFNLTPRRVSQILASRRSR